MPGRRSGRRFPEGQPREGSRRQSRRRGYQHLAPRQPSSFRHN
jgi:hypothetical protein